MAVALVDLLLTTTDDWLLAKDNRQATAVAFIDLAKAFDNVNHQVLLLNPIQARLFLSSCGRGGTLCPPFENHVPLVLTAYC